MTASVVAAARASTMPHSVRGYEISMTPTVGSGVSSRQNPRKTVDYYFASNFRFAS